MDGARVDAAGGTSSARRRRERRLRSMLRHERRAVAVALAEALHHSSGLKVMERAQHAALRGQETGTRAGVAGPAPVTEYVAPAPAVALSVPSQQLRPAYAAATFATGVNLDVTGMVYPQFSSTAVEGSASRVVGSLPLGEVSVATGVNLDVTGMVYPHFSSSAVEGSASQVVGSIPFGEVFAAPVFSQVHQEQLAAETGDRSGLSSCR